MDLKNAIKQLTAAASKERQRQSGWKQKTKSATNASATIAAAAFLYTITVVGESFDLTIWAISTLGFLVIILVQLQNSNRLIHKMGTGEIIPPAAWEEGFAVCFKIHAPGQALYYNLTQERKSEILALMICTPEERALIHEHYTRTDNLQGLQSLQIARTKIDEQQAVNN